MTISIGAEGLYRVDLGSTRGNLRGQAVNRRFPRSMRSQGERPGCGSHVKRVDHGDAFNA